MLSDEALKKELFQILCAFDSFCAENGVRYMLAYGTLIGAARHQGFIPWDDDIDVILRTEEYYKLRALAKADPWLDAEKRYRFLLPGDRNYGYSFIKVVDTHYLLKEKNISDRYSIGLYIDVFRADYWPEDPLREFLQLGRARLLLKMNEICIRGNLQDEKFIRLDKLLRPVDVLFRLLHITPESLCARLERQGKDNPPGRYMGNISEGAGNKRLDAALFDGVTHLTFEGKAFPCPEKYDRMLREIYGDYKKLPDPDKRVSNHSFTIVEQ